mgnify:CR=1 FL=1
MFISEQIDLIWLLAVSEDTRFGTGASNAHCSTILGAGEGGVGWSPVPVIAHSVV